MSEKDTFETVKLEMFVSEVLLALSKGITKAQTELMADSSLAGQVKINPKNVVHDKELGDYVLKNSGDLPRVHYVDFDIAVSSEENTQTDSGGQGGVDIRVVSSTLKTGIAKNKGRAILSRIKFSIPIAFPGT